jgi:hypothetical protein
MTLKPLLTAVALLFGATTILGATSISLAQSLPNYGPNAPSTGDSFGKPPSGTRPPGVTRNGYRSYAYQRRLNHRRQVQDQRPYE